MKQLLLSFISLIPAAMVSASTPYVANITSYEPNPGMECLPVAASRNIAKAPTLPDDYDNIITTQPNGELKLLCKDGIGWNMGWENQHAEGVGQYVVFAEDGSVYFRDLISTLQFNTWVKAEKTGEDTYTVRMQPISYQESQNTVIYVCNMLRGSTSSGQPTFTPDPETTDVTLKYKDGRFSYVAPDDQHIMGCWWGGDMQIWTGNGDVSSDIFKVDATATIVPENVEFAEYCMAIGEEKNPNKNYKLVLIGFDGNDVYMKHLPGFVDPELAIHGTIDGDKVIFKEGAYIGYDKRYNLFFYLMGEVSDWSRGYQMSAKTDGDMVFDYDAATKTMTPSATTQNSDNLVGYQSLCIARTTKGYSRFISIEKPVLSPFTEVAATPARCPKLTDSPYEEYYGYGNLFFETPNTDVDGNFINPDKMFYRIYADDETVEFYSDDYPRMASVLGEDVESITDLPITFDDYFGTQLGGKAQHCISYFFGGVKIFGIQIFYNGGGELRSSDICYSDGSVVPASVTEISKSDAEVVSTKYFDVTGAQIAEPSHGFSIKVSNMSDGSVKSVKIFK